MNIQHRLKNKIWLTLFQLTLWLGLISFFSLPLQAQEGSTLRFESITADDGFSSGYVSDILQDQQGFMWFATSEGLQKYDGYEFINYKPDPADPTSISHKGILSLYEDVDHGGVL